MIKTSLNWSIKNLKSMYDDKHTLDFSNPIQRQGGCWEGDPLKKSLLIHSILAGYPIPPLYCLKEPLSEKDYSYSILDGRQRLETVFTFLNGDYSLNIGTPSVVIDDVSYDLGGKFFTDLDIECQQEILRFKFVIYGFEDASDDFIEELFYRLNNGAVLSTPQKAMPLCGMSNAKFIKSLLSDKFYSEICQFSALQRRKSDDLCTLLQSMMLLDSRYKGYEYASISAEETMQYAASIKNNYSEGQKEHLFDIIDYLEKVFPKPEKMVMKINIPILMLVADTAMGKDYNAVKNVYRVGPMYFRQWFSYFCDECYGGYKQYCSSGSIKKEKTLKRIEIMEQSFRKYFELEGSPATEQDADNEAPSGEDISSETASHADDTPVQDNTPEDDPPQDTKDVPLQEAVATETEENSAQAVSENLSAVVESTAYTEQ